MCFTSLKSAESESQGCCRAVEIVDDKDRPLRETFNRILDCISRMTVYGAPVEVVDQLGAVGLFVIQFSSSRNRRVGFTCSFIPLDQNDTGFSPAQQPGQLVNWVPGDALGGWRHVYLVDELEPP